ncbi:MAG: bifunctional phosphopantothenoylcysteine decarboxylase/phosphopantothenate--cysteine ligase CoaBC [Desulfobacterales bacterium]|nr:bifunctional phosphopantothenoylcysteine decarboxylase/phosphopantothenate--cysteine ligase CoaBC [Desulfobacterales bacterium]
MLKARKIVLGVTGGIAAYKAVELVRRLVNLNAEINVIMTKNSQEFVTPLTFQTLSGNRVITGLFDLLEESKIGHIAIAQWADIFVIAPATANIIGNISNGIADDFLSTTVMATKAPVLIAPAMNTNMYENHIVQRNINALKSLGYHFVEPASGGLACGTEGLGKLAEIDDIIEEMESVLSKKDLLGERVMVTAGPTTEFIDPIRFITNRSTGKMGYAVARVARRRGAEVTLISGPSMLSVPQNIKFFSVKTALEMRAAVLDSLEGSTVVIKTAAVGDYKAKDVCSEKIKRERANLILELEETPDILSEIGNKKGDRIHVGFAAETEDLINNARSKLKNKNLDLIVANDVCMEGAGFESDTNIVKILDRDGSIEELPLMSKEEVAEKILDRVVKIKTKKSKTLG